MLFTVVTRLHAVINDEPTKEFVKGIPESLENDSYLDVNIRNLIIIDDQTIETGKDNRIVNLFTKGSHHRNLSVIYIVQNLFHQGKGNPRRGTPLYGLYRYVRPQNVWFFGCFGHK